jgi:hypothetical protein
MRTRLEQFGAARATSHGVVLPASYILGVRRIVGNNNGQVHTLFETPDRQLDLVSGHWDDAH